MPKVWLTTRLRRMRFVEYGQRGFSVIEVLLAATVFAMVATGAVGAIVYGRASTANAGDTVRAHMIAEEGIEAARNIDNASYANLVDNTTAAVGDTTIEAGNDNNIGTSLNKVASGTTAGIMTSMSVYIKAVDAVNPHVQMVIYADNAGVPGTRLATSSIQTAVTNSWNTFTVSGLAITASTNYWIGVSTDGNTNFADNGGGGSTAYDLSSAYPAPETFSVDSTAGDKPSFYFTVATTTYGLSKSGGQWSFSGTSDVTDIYTRKITIVTAGTNRQNVFSTVTWPENSGGTGSVTLSAMMTNWMAALPVTTGPIMMAYSKTTTIPYYRTWDGSAWSAEGAAQAVTGNINYVVLKSARTRNEAILGVQTSTGGVYVQMWNGTSWSTPTLVGTGPTTTRSFDIAYEKNSDHALIVYSPTAASADFAYRTWDGTTLSGATTVTAPPTTGAINWIELRQNPLSSSNDIAMLMLDANIDVYGMLWTGSAWSDMGTTTAWDTTASIATRKAMDVEYEQTSGKAMFMWGDSVSTNNMYRTWNGTTLSTVSTLTIAAQGGLTQWLQLAARPNSNEIMVGAQDAAGNLNTRKWSGSAWDTATQHAEHDAATENIASRNFDIIWETASANAGKAWLVWGDGATVTTKQWSGTAWGTAAVLSGSDDTSFIRLRADPISGAVFAGIYQNSTAASGAQDINERHLTGGGSTWSAKNTVWGGPTGADPVSFRIDIATP
jgi:prepilin-type N-terminal cleavage/methylation domain-containing protein